MCVFYCADRLRLKNVDVQGVMGFIELSKRVKACFILDSDHFRRQKTY